MKHLGRLLTLVVLATIPSCTAGNDAVGLSVEELTYDQLVQGEAATGAGSTVIDGMANGGAFHRNTVLLTTATASFNTTGTIMSGIVRARRGSGSCTPGLQIGVDGVGQLVTLSGGNTWTDYPFSVSRPAGSHTLSLYYRTGVSGCALDVDVVTFSVYEPTPPPTNTVTLEAENATGAGTNALDASTSPPPRSRRARTRSCSTRGRPARAASSTSIRSRW